MRPAPAIAAISLALACGHGGHAAGVFLPVGVPVPAGQTAEAPTKEAHRSRFARIAHNELQRARAEVGNFGRSHLLFNMSERLELDVTVERATPTLDGYTLSGHVDGGKGGFVTLAVRGQAVAGSIWTWEANYEIAPVGGGIHAVRQVMDEPLECGGVAQAPSVGPTAPAPASAVDEIAVVDFLAFWTPALEAAKGGEPHVKLTIDLAIAYTNDVLERSGAFVSLNLVGAERLDVPEASGYQLFDVLEGVHAMEQANALGADYIAAFHSGRYGAYNSAKGVLTAPNTYTQLSLNGPPYTSVLAHEVGHNLGLSHDRGATLWPTHSYKGGYVAIATSFVGTRCHSTTMAYNIACQGAGLEARTVPYYSTPNRHHPLTGTPLGVSRLSNVRGWDGPSDAVLEINQNRHRASNIRPRRSTP